MVDADEGTRLTVRVRFTDDAGHEERLTSAATDAVAAAPEPLTASFSGVPDEHTGRSFTFGLRVSEDFPLSYKTLRNAAFSVSGGAVRGAKRKQQGSNQRWTITVKPDSHAAVTVTLSAGAVETSDGRLLQSAVSATVAGPVGISVADARVDEGAVALLAFAVTLDRSPTGTVTVDYATSDGSATAGADYTATSGTLTFRAGESSQTIEVAVLDDSHDEGEETLTLTLSNASGGRLTDARATGTIENTDPMPRAFMARFGRTAAVHVRTDRGAARGGLRGPICRAAAAAGHGARVGGRVPQPAGSIGRGESSRCECSRFPSRLTGCRRQFARDTGPG